MNPSRIPARHRRHPLALLGLLWLATLPAAAGFPEPDVVLFGRVVFDGHAMTAASNVVVQARLVPMGGAVVQTPLGLLADDYYSLRLPIDSAAPVSRPNASLAGDTLYLTVLHNGQVRAQVAYEIRGKGIVEQVDFGDVDTDADALPDGWEQAYLLGLQSGPDDDPDLDGLVNRDEYRVGSHPRKVDAPHPADLAPRDNRITIAELSTYYNAWKKGLDWGLSPTNIPIEYVTRASTLWEEGEYYRQDLSVPEGAPLWWVSTPAPTTPGLAGTSRDAPRKVVTPHGADDDEAPLSVEALLPAVFEPDVPAVVQYRATVRTGLRTYAVEDYPPAGWRVQSVGPGGTYDTVNRKVKWGPFFDRVSRDFTYTVVPDRVGPDLAFTGVGSHDGRLVPVSGRRTVIPGGDPAGLSRLVFGTDLSRWAVEGPAGMRYEIEYSPDLRDWGLLTNGAADALGVFLFGPALPPGEPHGFIRARELGAELEQPR